MRIKIGTDSTADIPREVRERLDINVLPLSVVHEGREYVENVDITPEEFYVTLENCEKIPTSSQVTTQAYVDFYEKTFAAGYTDLIQISLNAKGSGTFQSGVIAKDLFFESHPEAAGTFAIHNVDSETYSMLYGHAVIKAAEMARDGASVEDILAKVERMVKAVRGVFVPLTLRFVKKSGRVSRCFRSLRPLRKGACGGNALCPDSRKQRENERGNERGFCCRVRSARIRIQYRVHNCNEHRPRYGGHGLLQRRDIKNSK